MIATASTYDLMDNVGNSLTVPLTAQDDLAYFTVEDSAEAIRDYYEENGYVVIRGLIPHDLLDAANRTFDAQVVPSKRFIYRQATANPERNVYTEHGFVLNSILNLQSLDPRFFNDFRKASEGVITARPMQDVLVKLFGEPGKLVQSMYFHGNPMTWPHQDSYYLDSEHIGAMTAVWIAAEDIVPGCGRFFIYPGSHKIDMKKNGGDFDIAFHHNRYKQLVRDIIKNKNLECRAPALSKGDALFWHAKTIHGSLPTSQPEHSRRSFTSHFIPQSHRFLQLQSRLIPTHYEPVNGMLISRPKDQASLKNRAVLFVETTFPKTFQTLKKLAVKFVTSR